MTKDLKGLVQQIQKMAKMPPKPGADWKPPTDRASIPQPGGTAPRAEVARGPSGDPGVRKMQEAIKQLALDVVSEMQGKGGTDPTSQKNQGARDSFGAFLARTFMRNSNVSAVEYSPDPNKKKISDKDPTAAHKMSWVMDTMERIGHTNTEFSADGVWGPRTQAALVNVIAFANALFQVAQAFNVPVKSYNEGYLRQLAPIAEATSKELTPEDKKQDAPVIAKHVTLIRKMYEEIKNQVLNIPRYQTYIEADTPYLSHEKSGVNLTPQQQASIKQTFQQGFWVPLDEKGTEKMKISVDDLMSVDTLNKWIAEVKQYYPNVQLDPYNVLTVVSDQVSKGA